MVRKRLRFEAVDGEFSVVAANSENRRYLARPEPVGGEFPIVP